MPTTADEAQTEPAEYMARAAVLLATDPTEAGHRPGVLQPADPGRVRQLDEGRGSVSTARDRATPSSDRRPVATLRGDHDQGNVHMRMPTNIGIIDTTMDGRERAPRPRCTTTRRCARASFGTPVASHELSHPVHVQRRALEPISRGAPRGPVENRLKAPISSLPFMDKWGIEVAMIGVSPANELAQKALRRHPDRFVGALSRSNANAGMDDVIR